MSKNNSKTNLKKNIDNSNDHLIDMFADISHNENHSKNHSFDFKTVETQEIKIEQVEVVGVEIQDKIQNEAEVQNQTTFEEKLEEKPETGGWELQLEKVERNFKIGICGAHGTGKTTLAKAIYESFGVPIITNLMRNFWQEHGVVDFEKLPKDVRAIFQKESLLRQIRAEDQSKNYLSKNSFITDRTVLDQLGYAKFSSNMQGVEFEIYEQLCKERLQNYSHLFYLPIEFEAEDEFLRAAVGTRDALDKIMKSYLDLWMSGKYTIISGSLDARLLQINELLR